MQVSFRFYAQLNDFLRPEQRGRRFCHALRGPSSVKDAIEALGVPHPEVDVILVGRAAVQFEYLLRDGDIVTVYPTFRSLDLTGLARVGQALPAPIRFVVDAHLGKLATLLRLAGLDALVIDDDEGLAEQAARDARVLLTRDRGLLKRHVIRNGRWIRNTDPDMQLIEVLQVFDLATELNPFTRCLRCNGLLEPVSRDAILTRLPPRARALFRQFHACGGCGRIYWPGSHYERLRQRLDEAVERAAM